MCAVKTYDVEKVVQQANLLYDAGAGLVRIAVDNPKDAAALPEIRRLTQTDARQVNLSVDLQENYRMAELAAPWVDKLRYNPGHLYQQNTLRDAMVAAINLNIFPRYAERLKMANIAQLVNVLQAMILTDGPRMVLTPTYHVFRMFGVHQNALRVPVDVSCGTLVSAEGRIMEDFSAAASRDAAGALHLSLANPRADKAVTVELAFDALRPGQVSGEILQADRLNAYNDFGKAPAVAPKPYKDAKISGKTLRLTLPAASIVVLEVK